MSQGVQNTHRYAAIGYRARWCYFVVWLAAALIWWAAYVEGTFIEFRGFQSWTPVRGFVELVHFHWLKGSGSDSWLPSHGNRLFGLNVSHLLGSLSQTIPVPDVLILAMVYVFALGLNAFIGCYVGFNSATIKRLPARALFGWMPRSISVFMVGLCFAGFCALGIEFWVTKIWGFAIIPSHPRFYGIPLYLVRSSSWQFCLLTVLGGGAWGLLMMARLRREQYWQLERFSRYPLYMAILLLLASELISLGRWSGYIVEYYDYGVTYTASFIAWSVMVWALGCRAWLLFRLKRFEKLKLIHDRESPECFACGYNLHGSVLAGSRSCPECGVSIPRELLASQ